ncbi:MAG TPA: outer membrane beta-barrel protein [Methylocystis sp.]
MDFQGARICTKTLTLGSSLLAAVASGAAAADAGAQSAPSGSAASSTSAEAALGASTGPKPDTGIPLRGWMFYPSFLSGAVFTDNLYQLPKKRIAGVGFRVSPSLQGFLDNGLHRSTLYFMADVLVYPGQGGLTAFTPTPTNYNTPTNVSGQVGFSHIWSPREDLAFSVDVDYTRQNGVIGPGYVGSPKMVNIPSTGVVSNTPQFTNQYTAYMSAEKKFADRWFVRGTTGAQYLAYDSRPSEPYLSTWLYGANFFRASDGLAYMASLRGGYWLTPQVYGFIEPSANSRFYQNSFLDTNGYRIIAGLGSDMIGLFRGEIYGGYQQQMRSQGYFDPTSSPAFGARIFYYPTRYIKVTASVDQPLSSGLNKPAIAFGFPVWSALHRGVAASISRTLIVRLQADYALSEYWTAYVRGGYGESRYSNPPDLQTQWAARAGLIYNLWRNVAVTMEYQVTKTSSNSTSNWWALTGTNWSKALFWNGASSGYTQNSLSAGLTYTY